MDFNLKQWRDHESEEDDQQTSATASKLPRLFLDSHSSSSSSSAQLLPLSESTKLHRMGSSSFNMAQWQELELQALIFRHMVAGAAVPPELLHLLKKTLNSSTDQYHPYNNHHLYNPLYYPHYQTPSLMQSSSGGGYWGKGAMDPEPGRCRRTDGKKWRCSRDVVAGHKYCERHMHRGRNRSRKPVETHTSNNNNNNGDTSGGGGGGGGGAAMSRSASNRFTLTGHEPSMDLLHQLNPRPSESIAETKNPFEAQNDGQPGENRTLRHFFDDWPRSLNGPDNASTNLSISMPGNPSSDFSLKLGTGNVNESSRAQDMVGERDRPQLNWGAMWGAHTVTPMGGPLAEALRSSASTSSPTSVLHRLQKGSVSETSYVST